MPAWTFVSLRLLLVLLGVPPSVDPEPKLDESEKNSDEDENPQDRDEEVHNTKFTHAFPIGRLPGPARRVAVLAHARDIARLAE